MNTILKLTWIEAKLFWRDPGAIFFTVALPLILLFVFGNIYGNEPVDQFGGYGLIDISVPGFIGMIIGTVGLMGLPATIATYRETGVLRRYRVAPIRSINLLVAHILVNLVLSSLGVLLLVMAGWFVFDLRLPVSLLGVVSIYLLGSFSFYAMSFVLASIAPSARSAQAIATAIFFPMLFVSGAVIPRSVLPDTLRRIGDMLPMTQINIGIQDFWFGDGLNLTAFAALIVLLALGSLISIRVFRWE